MNETAGSDAISDATMEKIEALISQADDFLDEGETSQARERFETALGVVPSPHQDYEVATWLLTAMADAHFFDRNFEAAAGVLAKALEGAGGSGNPFVHLRLGQCHLELGDETQAADQLSRAFMGDGEKVFADEDPKYLRFLKSKLTAPESN